MEYLIEFFLPLSSWFQSAPPWIFPIMRAVTFLGDTEFYLLAMPLLYWCIDLALGIRIGIILLISGGFNSILKFGFASPRPFCVTSEVDSLVEATGFGFPSGHSQNAAGIWGLLAATKRNTWIKILSILLIITIGLSRIFLGVHFAHDVFAGWIVGLILLWLFITFEQRVVNWFKNSSVSQQVYVLVFITLLFIIIPLLIVNPLNPPNDHGSDLCSFNPYNFDGLLTTTGSLFGLGLGVILLYQTGWFNVDGPFWRRIIRYLVGLIGVISLYLGLGWLFPDELSILSFVLRFVRYFLIGLWISFGAPKFFQWTRLS